METVPVETAELGNLGSFDVLLCVLSKTQRERISKAARGTYSKKKKIHHASLKSDFVFAHCVRELGLLCRRDNQHMWAVVCSQKGTGERSRMPGAGTSWLGNVISLNCLGNNVNWWIMSAQFVCSFLLWDLVKSLGLRTQGRFQTLAITTSAM